jgi:hypothetical protein
MLSIGINIVQHNMMPEDRALIGYGGRVGVGEEKFFQAFMNPLLVYPTVKRRIRFSLQDAIRESDPYDVA